VEAVLLYADRAARPAREIVNPRSGVVGYQLPALRATVHPLAAGDTLVFATDGIEDGFSSKVSLDLSPQAAAADILNRFGKNTDDALVVVARWWGAPP
jgi:hypothetical protein